MSQGKHIGRVAKYPWDKWFSRKRSFSLHHNKDFDCDPYSMMVYFRQMAKRRNCKVHIFLNDTSLDITLEKET